MNCGYEGRLSCGKTAMAVLMVKYIFDSKHKDVITNHFLDIPGCKVRYFNDIDLAHIFLDNYGNKVFFRDFLSDKILFIDEVTDFIDARFGGSSKLNEVFTGIFRFLGKIDCDFVYTYQNRESMVDKRVREIANIFVKCSRHDYSGRELIMEDRIVPYPILIKCEIELQTISGPKTAITWVDPRKAYPLYHTRDFDMLDRAEANKSTRKPFFDDSYKVSSMRTVSPGGNPATRPSVWPNGRDTADVGDGGKV